MQTNKLYVGNILYEVTDQDLHDFFSQAGTVVSANVVRFHDTGKSKGFAFVEMSTPEEAQAAIDQLNETDFKDRTVYVSFARPPRPRTNDNRDRGSFRHGGGGGNRRNNRFDRNNDRDRDYNHDSFE